MVRFSIHYDSDSSPVRVLCHLLSLIFFDGVTVYTNIGFDRNPRVWWDNSKCSSYIRMDEYTYRRFSTKNNSYRRSFILAVGYWLLLRITYPFMVDFNLYIRKKKYLIQVWNESHTIDFLRVLIYHC